MDAKPPGFMSLRTWAKIHRVKRTEALELARAGRVPGAVHLHFLMPNRKRRRVWVVPWNAGGPLPAPEGEAEAEIESTASEPPPATP